MRCHVRVGGVSPPLTEGAEPLKAPNDGMVPVEQGSDMGQDSGHEMVREGRSNGAPRRRSVGHPAAGAGDAVAGIAIGLRRIDGDRLPYWGLMSAAFFVASLMHVPVGPSNVHLILNGLLGIVLGWAAVPAIFVGLLLQALFFGYGGITVSGVNTVIMGLSRRRLLLSVRADGTARWRPYGGLALGRSPERPLFC
jgi:hypothetical protein